jgi:hypothetical protein
VYSMNEISLSILSFLSIQRNNKRNCLDSFSLRRFVVWKNSFKTRRKSGSIDHGYGIVFACVLILRDFCRRIHGCH